MADLLARCAVYYARQRPTISSCLLKKSSRRRHPIVATLSRSTNRPLYKPSNVKHGQVHHGRVALQRILGAVFYVILPLFGIFLLSFSPSFQCFPL